MGVEIGVFGIVFMDIDHNYLRIAKMDSSKLYHPSYVDVQQRFVQKLNQTCTMKIW